ncbi:hypothetical protein FRC09_009952 [Ceratobasidium sp. 395]|nr:hypothetical protein FRC09_009952 [Ceratobasidium sp. 395]
MKSRLSHTPYTEPKSVNQRLKEKLMNPSSRISIPVYCRLLLLKGDYFQSQSHRSARRKWTITFHIVGLPPLRIALNQAKQAGAAADPVKDFVVYKSGGDGGKIQFWYVGWWPSKQSVVVAHQGTELNNTQAVLTDLEFIPLPLNATRFPGAPLTALVHLGFKAAHARTASIILTTVKDIIAEKQAKTVISVGHSLGGALALLEGLHLRLNLPTDINVITRTFGQPRVGNDVFAQFVDQKLPDLARLTIKRDIVPVVPPLTSLYRHSSGEVHFNAQDVYNSCSGRDNTNENCSTGQVLTQGIELVDHLGPYPGGIRMGTQLDIGALC